MPQQKSPDQPPQTSSQAETSDQQLPTAMNPESVPQIQPQSKKPQPQVSPEQTQPQPTTLPESASATQTTPAEQPQQPIPERPKGKSKFAILLILLFFLLVGTFPVVLAYTNYRLLPVPKAIQQIIDSAIIATPLPENPRMILYQTQKNMSKVKTATLETKINLETKQGQFLVKTATVTIKGPADFKTSDMRKSQFEISAQVATEGLTLSAAGSVRQIEDRVYFKVTEIPGGALGLSAFKDQWYFTETDILGKQQTEQDKQTSKKLKDTFEKLLADSHDWTTKQKGQENNVYYLLIKPPKERINDFIFEIIQILEQTEGKQTQLEKSLDKEKLKEYIDKVENIQFNLHVDKKTHLISESKASLDFSIDAPTSLNQFSPKVSLPQRQFVKFNFSISIKFTDYNAPIIVEIPQGAQDINKLLEPYKKLFEDKNLLPSPSPSPGTSGRQGFLDDKSPVLGEKDSLDQMLNRLLYPQPSPL